MGKANALIAPSQIHLWNISQLTPLYQYINCAVQGPRRQIMKKQKKIIFFFETIN